jgi:hypothetical protein
MLSTGQRLILVLMSQVSSYQKKPAPIPKQESARAYGVLFHHRKQGAPPECYETASSLPNKRLKSLLL